MRRSKNAVTNKRRIVADVHDHRQNPVATFANEGIPLFDLRLLSISHDLLWLVQDLPEPLGPDSPGLNDSLRM